MGFSLYRTSWRLPCFDDLPESDVKEDDMRLVAARALALGALLGLYALSPVAGVVALAAGYGFIAGRRTPELRVARHTTPFLS